MADIRINALTSTAGTTASDDYFAVDGAANGTRKLSAYSPVLGGNLTVGGGANLTSSSTNSYIYDGTGWVWTSTGTSGGTVKGGIYAAGGQLFLTANSSLATNRFSLNSSGDATVAGNLTVSGTGSFGGATGPHTFGNGAGAVEVRAVGDSSGYYGYSFYTGGSYESSLKHTAGSGILKLDVGRNSAWGGSFEIYADTTRAARFAKTSTTLDGNLTVSGTGTSTFSGPIRINATSSAPTAGSFSTSAGNGLEIWPKSGSSYDLLVYTAAGSSLLSVPSGTNNLNLAGNLTVSGTGGISIGSATFTGGRALTATTGSGNSVSARLLQTGVADWEIKNVATTGALSFQQSASDLMSLSATGNLTVSGTVQIDGFSALFKTQTATLATIGSAYAAGHGSYRAEISFGAQNYGSTDAGYIGFRTSATYNTGTLSEVGRFAANGNLLLGTTTDSGNGKLQLATHTTSAGGIGFGTDTSAFRTSAGFLAIRGIGNNQSGVHEFQYTDGTGTPVTGAGYVGVAGSAGALATGTAIGDVVLRGAGAVKVASGGGTTALILDSTQRALFASDIILTMSSRPPMIYSSGSTLYFGTSGGTLALTLDGSQNATFAGKITATSSSQGILSLTGSSSTGTNIRLKNTATNGRDWGINSNVTLGNGEFSLYDYTAGYESFRITGTSSGTVTIYPTGGLIVENGTIKTAAPSGGTAANWKLGTVATVSPTSPNRTIEVEIGGTTYYIHAKTTNN